MRHTLQSLVLVLCTTHIILGQDKAPANTYYQTYENQVTGRTYLSRKFTSVVFSSRDKAYALRYRPNTSLNLGVGATYKWATLNLAYGFGFLNPDGARGKTRYLDMQFHSYGRKISIDVLGQFYNGFYLSPRGYGTTSDRFYVRPDLKVRAVGATVQYIFNHRAFSYRAAFLQNEWQKRSAGTWLVGLELFAGSIRADSTIFPTTIDEVLAQSEISKFTFLELGPNVGYAYTFVYKQHYFLTGAGSVSLDLGFNNITDRESNERSVGFNPNTLFRVSGGYNSTAWAITALYVTNALRLSNHDDGPATTLRTGNVRLIVTHRFKPSKKLRKYLEPIEDVQDQIE
jgi:Domain of unknown function (DUF4421)